MLYMNIVHIYIVLVIISMELLYLIMFGSKDYKIEGMTGENIEAISNIASLYNNQNMTVSNLTVTGKLTAPNLETHQINTPVGHDWLRINEISNGAGKVAIFGNLSVNEVRNGHAGVSVGHWAPTTGKGDIEATNVKTRSLNTPKGHDWLRINDGGVNSAGRVAVYGNLSVASTQNGHSGLVSGAHNSTISDGEIHGSHISPTHIKTNTIDIGPTTDPISNWKLGVAGDHLVFQSPTIRELTNPINLSKHHRQGNSYAI